MILARITTTKRDFVTLARSHGWVFLSPFEWHPDNQTVMRILSLPDGLNLKVAVKARQARDHTSIVVLSSERVHLNPTQRKEMQSQIVRMFRLDEDFSEFHRLCRGDPVLSFVPRIRCGGILRSPSYFEDLIKTVCTTNCDWRNTKKMCSCLCSLQDGAFPAPEVILRCGQTKLRVLGPFGYRVRTIHEVAEKTVEGAIPLDEWAESGDYARIRCTLKQIWGIGDYVMSHMLVLLGDYREIPVDSEVLSYLRNTHFEGASVAAKDAVRPYDPYGKYRFLAFKFGRIARKLNYIDS